MKPSFIQTQEITCKPTLEQLASMVAHLDSDDHARLISLIAEITQRSDYLAAMQLQSITDNPCLTPAGRFFMSQIGSYAFSKFFCNGWQLVITAGRDPKIEVLGTDYDSIEIIHWVTEGNRFGGWEDRDCRPYFPSLWQPLPPVPSPLD